MANKKASFVFWTMMLCTLGLFAAVSAANAAPGGESDPLVTRSYVDKRVNEVLSASGGAASINTDELMAQVEYAVKNYALKESGSAFAPVSVEMGKTIFGGEGCEMIMRTGAGFIVTSTDTVVNATTGVDLANGAEAPKGSLLIFPRDDGRGVKATNNCWFLVKGSYTIK